MIKIQIWFTGWILALKEGEILEKIKDVKELNELIKNTLKLLEENKIDKDIKLLTIKEIYKSVGIDLPIEIEAKKDYHSVEEIALKLGLTTKHDKPAGNGVKAVIEKLKIRKSDKKIVWETNGIWQGTVEKYTDRVRDMVEKWLIDKGHPREILHRVSDEKVIFYKVYYEHEKKLHKNDSSKQMKLDI